MRTADGYIIDKCLNGDSAAFGLLVDKYRAGVYALAYSKLLNFHDAEDIAQEVFIKAYRKLRSLKRYDSFHAWLYSITSNECKNFIRNQSRRLDRHFICDEDRETLEEVSVDSYREESVRESIREALESMPENHQQVLSLYYLGGMNSREIAEFLGISPNAVRHRLIKARAQLKEGVLAKMSTTFAEHRLPASFTLRIVEIVKRVRIHPMPRTTGVPWGLSLAAGITLVVLGLSPHLSIPLSENPPMGTPLLSEKKALKTGEIPVDILELSRMPTIGSNQEDGDNGIPSLPEPENTPLMTPRGEGRRWTKRADMPTARYLHSSCIVDGGIYVIGGWDSDENELSTMEVYDPASDTWARKAGMPTARGMLATCQLDGKIYAIGGSAGGGIYPLAAFEVYDIETDTWTKKPDMPVTRACIGASVVDGRIYVIGGGSTNKTVAEPLVQEYDPETDTWTRKADMPTGRGYILTRVLDGKIYAIGGNTHGANSVPHLEVYDPVTDTWEKKTSMPTARQSPGVCVVDGKIYVVGGTSWRDTVFSTVEVYDPATDTWTTEDGMPEPRFSISADLVNEKIYAIGGVTTPFSWEGSWKPTSTVEEWDLGLAPLQKASSTRPNGKINTPWGKVKSH